jgi:RNA polymerase sigma factor (sigma-70 family)
VDCTATPQNPPGDGFEPWETSLARSLVYAYVTSYSLPRDVEPEDLVQECLLHWWRQRRLHDPERGASLATFMRRVLTAKLADIARAERATKRMGFTEALSLDETISDDDEEGDEGTTWIDMLPDDMPDWQTEEAADRALLKERIDRVIAMLSPRQQRLIEMLHSDASMARISRTLAIPRTTLYDELARIRKVFRDEGLEQFLE